MAHLIAKSANPDPFFNGCLRASLCRRHKCHSSMGLGPCVVERNGSLVRSKWLEFSWTIFGSRVNMGNMKYKYIPSSRWRNFKWSNLTSSFFSNGLVQPPSKCLLRIGNWRNGNTKTDGQGGKQKVLLWYIYVLQKRELIYISFKEIMHIAMYMEVKLIELVRLIWVPWVKCFLKHWYLFSTSCVENCSGLPDTHFGVGFLLQLFSFEW